MGDLHAEIEQGGIAIVELDDETPIRVRYRMGDDARGRPHREVEIESYEALLLGDWVEVDESQIKAKTGEGTAYPYKVIGAVQDAHEAWEREQWSP